MKIGDKAKVIDKKSILYNKKVELIAVRDEAYIFYYGNPKLKLVVHKDAIQRTIEWESSPDKGENKQGSNKTQHWITRGLLNRNLAQLGEERKKQVLATSTLGIVQRYCEEMPNKMEVVAALFGKRLGEEFKVQKADVTNPCYAVFTVNGLAITDGNGYLLTGMDIDLMGYTVNTEDLLTARAVIVDE